MELFVDYSSDCDEKYPSVYACYSSVLKQSSAGKSDAEEKVKILKFFDNASSGICLIHFDEEDILKDFELDIPSLVMRIKNKV